MVKQVAIDDGRVRVAIQLTSRPVRSRPYLGREVEAALRRLPGCDEICGRFFGRCCRAREIVRLFRSPGRRRRPASA
jgi:hypothetical protein